jgi:phage shock protein A
MALLERVTTLVRANVNDLIDKAEDPEKMIKQLILDMQNQLLQVKTQVAVAMADEHLLEKRQKEHEEKAAEWMHKAELAVDKKQDDLARAALERHSSYVHMAEAFKEQVADQRIQVENLKSALRKLEQKLAETESKSDLLLARHRRARAANRAGDAQLVVSGNASMAGFDRMKQKVMQGEALSRAKSEIVSDTLDDRFAKLEKEDEIEQALAALKSRRGATG